MKKTHTKYVAILLILIIAFFMLEGIVKAAEIVVPDLEKVKPIDPTDPNFPKQPTTPTVNGEENEVSHRDIALASALSYLRTTKNKTISNSNLEIATDFNEAFNLYNYGTVDEINDWKVVDYRSRIISERGMTAFTLKKDNNIIIVFRGTDTEAVEDVIGYGVRNYHAQEGFAEQYTLDMAKKYAKEGQFNFYITGHSLGGYLCQISGATLQKAIDNANKGTTDWNGWNIKKTYNINDYLENGSFEIYKNITLKQIVAFNGMGMNVSKVVKETVNNLVGQDYEYQDQTEKIEILKRLGDEGKLIGYYVYGDAVSGLGTFYGEMRRITPSIDAITNRRENIYENAFGRLKLAQNMYSMVRKLANPWSTEIEGAKKLYNIDSLLMYLLLTHEPDTFASILETKEQQEYSSKVNTPSVAIMKANKSELVKELMTVKGETKIETSKSITLKAITSYASAKKYEWFESDDGINWSKEPVKVFTLEDANITPTNRFEVDISKINSGSSKFYKVVSYYNDEYVSSKFNETEGKYVAGEKGEHGEGTVEQIIEIKHKNETLVGKVVNTVKTIINNIINKVKSLFKR